jgi:hypothetical protein
MDRVSMILPQVLLYYIDMKFIVGMMILLQQSKKRRESGKKCHVKNYDTKEVRETFEHNAHHVPFR